MDLAFVLRSPGLAIYYIALDALLIPAAGGATFLLAQRLKGITPWQPNEILFLLGYATLVEGILSAMFTYNVAHISRRIGRGQFDHLLVQPQSLWLAMLSEGFAPISGGGAVLTGVGILAFAIPTLVIVPDVHWWLAFFVNLVASVAAVLGAMYAWSAMAFWAPVSAEEVSMTVHDAVHSVGAFPLDGVPHVLRVGLLTAIPAGMVAWFPSRALLGIGVERSVVPSTDAISGLDLWIAPMLAIGIVAVGAMVFRIGLRQYRRTGSTRYTDFGHRR